MAVARAGGAVSLVGAVGEDGAWIIRDLDGYGVSTANISIVQVQYAPAFDGRDLALTASSIVIGGHWPRYHSTYSARRKLHQYVCLRLLTSDMTSK